MKPRRGVRRSLGRMVRNLFLRNVWLKLISLVFAVGLYAFIHSAQNAQRTLMVDLTVFLPPRSANRQLMTQLPNRISVTVQGLKPQLDTLRGEDIGPIAMDLTEGTRRDYWFDPAMLNLPPQVTVKRIVPASLDLSWEDIVGRKIPVQVVLTGEPAPGYEVQGDPEVEPPKVEVRGPENLINVIQFLRATDFDISGLAEGEYARHLAIDHPSELAAFDASYDVNDVLVTVRIGQKLMTRSFERLKVDVIGVARATTRPATVDVTVTGPPDRVEHLRPEVIVPRVELETDAGELPKTGTAYADVIVSVPDVEIEVIPSKVMVRW